ncbi:TIM barrel protein [Paramaledivibacter caminithermalis]|jgi:sugar phosphate isomerase/epimerase|uniref:Sugar phosphate isomerase/epimerase n=1 Tax=Paramaledivibacter caminithermalis (strain DSM 15212 / CIP 107654 / DViRD3) TaxID=1121301 RepID=A0A1M6NQ70_PARC5|nr:TIM barrel protein [Paramaledivibacter caminithermalis]SHJ97863.1 Sugar phosphate isomerase/epimerase [Paramaledivibacter caminithermalis DSM 15212]
MIIGFTLDEKIFDKITPIELLYQTKKMGTRGIEVSPDEKILPINTYYEIAKLCNELDIEINYHVPYFADNFLYEIMNFNEYKKNIKSKYEALISIISNMQSIICKPSILTIHGANYEGFENKEKALYNTLSFFDWYLNFLDKKNIHVRLALETLNKNQDVIGNSREDIKNITREFMDSKLGICLDICHDSFNYYPGKAKLEDNFYKDIIYCHIHGINIKKSISHIAIKNSDIDFKEQINFLLDKNFQGVLNLELLVSLCGNDYLKDLYDDIDYIKNKYL